MYALPTKFNAPPLALRVGEPDKAIPACEPPLAAPLSVPLPETVPDMLVWPVTLLPTVTPAKDKVPLLPTPMPRVAV